MTHPFIFARTQPDKPAIIMAESSETLTYGQLEERANRNAHLLRSMGLQRGDCIAAILENTPAIFEIAWAADRIGLYFCAISNRLTAGEAEYIVRDSGSKALFTSASAGPMAAQLGPRLVGLPMFMRGPSSPTFSDWDAAQAIFPNSPVEDESAGGLMLYSSGTTGRPKGVKRPLPETGILTVPIIGPLLTQVYGAKSEWSFLTPAPLYHAAPLGWSMMAQRLGCTVVVMEKFDAEGVLRAIEKYRIDIAQFVPTHFIRMLKLPQAVRSAYDLSSLKTVFHAAAPCPVPVKEAMLAWWGPIINEYYSGTEGNGLTAIGPDEWIRKKGSVGRPFGCQVHACDDNGDPLPQGQNGQVFFSGGSSFEYHNDAEKTAESRNKSGWSTMGDIGHVDEEGYLFLTDRKSFVIISGGVNIYPQEIENLLVTHPKVADVAVIGAPDEEMGEKVIAIIQPINADDSGPELAEQLIHFCREQLSGVKMPRQFDFVDELPRHPTGKLFKRLVRDCYWANTPMKGLRFSSLQSVDSKNKVRP